jgi:uncharacterized iron-regulated membrane protein
MLSLRGVLFAVHLRTGLIAGTFFILLGFSHSPLVYSSLLQASAGAPKAIAQGSPP